MSASSNMSVHSQTNTMQSIGNQIGYKVRNFASHGQPTIEINLGETDGPRHTWTTSYSTMDTLAGTVDVTAPQDMRFEDVDIAFMGTSQVFVDRLTATPSVTGRTEATHCFLILRQPMRISEFPSPRIFEAGKTYKFPFTFTVPAQLLPKACPHNVVSDHVRDCHLLLPPSLGDPDVAGFGSSLLDDFAPEMSKITYGIKVRIVHRRGADGKLSVLGEKVKKIRIKPAVEEQPPLNIDDNYEFRPRQEKTVKKGLFKGKLGTLTAQVMQPKPLRVPGARTSNNKPITTMAKLVVRFDPADETCPPPTLGSLKTKLKVSTYYASTPRKGLPTRDTLGFDLTQGVYSQTIPLSSLCIASAQWEKHTSASNPVRVPPTRRDSGISDCSTSSNSSNSITATTTEAFDHDILPPSSTYIQGTFYTALILVPITLPSNKSFPPTFHSCLISRTYSLTLHLCPRWTECLRLKVPFQICADGSEGGIENARARARARSMQEEEGEEESWGAFVGERRRGSGRGGGDGEGREEQPPEYSIVTLASVSVTS